MTTDERIKKIEGLLVRVRWFNRCLIACIVLSLGVWFISKNFVPDTLRAKRFILEDENGKTCAALVVDEIGPSLSMFDYNGKVRVMLRINEEGPMLGLSDENQNPGVILAMLKWKPGLELYRENGNLSIALRTTKEVSALMLCDENEKTRIMLGHADDKGPSLGMFGADGMPIVGIP